MTNVWPNFLIVGEPRSGTTTLHDWLSQHPDIYMSSVKEPHYFSTIEFPEIERKIHNMTKDKEKYLKLFADGAEKQFRGESSTHYLSDPNAPKLIKNAIPDVKLIAVLREPVERAHSHYLLYGRRGDQQQSFREAVEENIAGKTNLAYDLVEMGRYYNHLKNYLKYFNRDQILILFFDDLKKNPKKVMQQVLDFLGADKNFTYSFEPTSASNAFAEPRNKLASTLLSNKRLTNVGLKYLPRPLVRKIRGKLMKSGKKPAMDKDIEVMLTRIYRKEVDQLEKLIKADCSSLRR